MHNVDLDSLTRDALTQVEIEEPLSADELEELLGILARFDRLERFDYAAP